MNKIFDYVISVSVRDIRDANFNFELFVSDWNEKSFSIDIKNAISFANVHSAEETIISYRKYWLREVEDNYKGIIISININKRVMTWERKESY